MLDTMPEPPGLPNWLAEADIGAYAEDFARHGERAFTGGLNWYRNIERNNELLAPFRGRGIEVPALDVVGDRDMVTSLEDPDRWRVALPRIAPLLHDYVILPGCGRWTQQERPAEVNAAHLDFLAPVNAAVGRWAGASVGQHRPARSSHKSSVRARHGRPTKNWGRRAERRFVSCLDVTKGDISCAVMWIISG